MISECLGAPAGSGAYIEQVIIQIDQEVNFDRFSRAWLRIIQHHRALCLGFSQSTSGLFEQYMFDLEELNIETNDWSQHSRQAAIDFLNMFIQADRRLGFSPLSPPLFRIALLKLEKDNYTVIFTFFSALADRKTLALILKDLFLVYANASHPLSQPIAQSHPTAVPAPESIDVFWENYFCNTAIPVTFPFTITESRENHPDRRKRKEAPLTTQTKTSVIAQDQARHLNLFCKKHNIKLECLLMGAFAIILSHYSGQDDIILCLQRHAENAVPDFGYGNQTNLVPAKFVINPVETFSQFLHEVHDNWHRTEAHGQTSLSQIRSSIRCQGNTGLFDMAFSYQERGLTSAIKPYFAKIGCKQISIKNRAPFSLFLMICGTDDLSLSLHYDRRRFEENVVSDMLDHLKTLLATVGEDRNPTLSEMPLLTDQQRDEMIQQLNPYPLPHKPDSCLHHLFEIQASTHRHIRAVSTDTLQVTYGQLNDRANQIAHYLIRSGATPGSRLVILIESTVTLIPVQLGILKAGCTVIPLSPRQVGHNFAKYYDALLPDMVITSRKWSANLPAIKEKILLLETADNDVNRLPQTPPGITVSPNSIAFILPVLDGAEAPSGIMLAHYALISYARSAIEIYDIVSTDRLLLTKTDDTAALTAQIFLGLLSGATLAIGPWDSLPSPLILMDFCKAQGVTILELHKRLWQRFIQEQNLAIPDTVKLLILNDGRTIAKAPDKWKDRIPETVRAIVAYGTAQTTGAAFWTELSDPTQRASDPIPIGRPFPGVCFTLLNRFKQPALPNTAGELFIGGMQIAQGYFNEESKTREQFHDFNFSGHSVRFFKTGDCATLSSHSGDIYHSPSSCQPVRNNNRPNPKNSTGSPNRADAPEKDTKPPIILVGNSVRAARSYKKADRSGYPFFHAPIFIHFYDANGQVQDLDIPKIATKCIDEIRKEHPNGPYILIGECQNALVAHEMAVQLNRLGIEVPLFIVIDENWQAQRNDSLPTLRQNFLQKLITELKANGIRHLFSKVKKRLGHKWVNAYSSLDLIRKKLYIRLGLSVPEAIQYRTMEKTYYSACETHPYAPPHYDGRVLLLYSKAWKTKFNPRLNRYYTGPTQKISLPIEHSHWFRPEQVRFILKEIRQHA